MSDHAAMLRLIYTRLHAHFGPQHWWPGDTPFEVMVGAILTQHTSWRNVAQAIANLKARDLLRPHALAALPPAELAAWIRPAGYFNLKTKRLRSFLHYFLERYDGDVERMRAQSRDTVRAELLQIEGIGPETADSILLYALGKPVFVIDAYTHRILRRHALSPEETTYDELQSLFHDQVPADPAHYNEYHALLVAVGKEFCRKSHPQCGDCPLRGINWPDGMKSADP